MRLEAFLRLTEAVGRARNMSDVYEAAIDCVERSLGVTRAALLLFDDDGVMRFKAWRGISAEYRATVEGHTPWTPQTRSPGPVVTCDVLADPGLAAYGDAFAREEIRAIALIPIVSDELVIGKLVLYGAIPASYAPDELRGAIAVAHQIALVVERRRSHERMNEVASLLRTLVENLPIGVSYTDASRHLRYANPAISQILGMPSLEPLLGQNTARVREMVSRSFADPESYLRVAQEMEDSGEAGHRHELRLADGRVIERRYFAIRSEGDLVAHMSLLEDITARRQSETELLHAQKIESVGRLAGGIAHDFNNLLFAISGNIELARAALAADSAPRRLLDESLEASKQAAQLTRQLLSFARKQPVRAVALELHALLERMQPILRRLVREDIDIRVEWDGRPAVVVADPGQLEQVIANLVLNARDAMPGGGSLTLSCRVESGAPRHPHGLAALVVRDTGSGMDEETLRHIFEPFFTTKELGRGTGLGLSTVHGIVQQARGTIEVSSRPGEGTEFRVLLPCSAEVPEAPPAIPEAPSARGRGVILLAEDDAAVRRLVESMLSGLGYTVLSAESGEQAQKLFEAHGGEVDLLLSDIVMPGTNGGDLAKRLRRARPGLRVLLISGYVPDSAAGGMVAGEHALLAKPFTAESLARRVREVLADAPPGSPAKP